MSSSSASLPGFRAPAVGFEQPFEMLEACHERVQRSLALLGRIVDHLDTHGHGDDTRSAAADVLRYFDLAAPHHHDDEERHVFPPLLEHPDAAVRATVAQLMAEHVAMSALWQRLRAVLLDWRDVQSGPVTEAERALIDEFTTLYAAHIGREEQGIYPAAQAGMGEPALTAMGRDMAARRQQGAR